MEITMDDLVKPCDQCRGTGKSRPDGPDTRNNYCEICQGTGKRLTETGKVLKQFLAEASHLS